MSDIDDDRGYEGDSPNNYDRGEYQDGSDEEQHYADRYQGDEEEGQYDEGDEGEGQYDDAEEYEGDNYNDVRKLSFSSKSSQFSGNIPLLPHEKLFFQKKMKFY
jgi:hypothetical protein